MTPLVAELNFWLALGTLALQALTVLLLVHLIWRPRGLSWMDPILSRFGLLAAFALTFVSSALTLLYSEVFGFIPCGLCWMERIFLYPQVILLGIALFKAEGARIADYIIGLSIPGALIALYHHYIQMGGSSLPCPAAGAGADCSKRILFEFDYVTFPLMAFSAFAFLIVLMLLLRRAQ